MKSVNRKIIGYARVSTEEQNLDLQTQALERAGCEYIFTDCGISGNTSNRPGLDRALKILKQGDKLIVWRLDRLGRSLIHLVQLLDSFGRKGVRFQSLCEYIDTSSSGGRLVFHMMAALAEFERTLISERTQAGMAAARARGKHLGRYPSLNYDQSLEALKLLQNGKDASLIAAQFGITERTLLRLTKRVSPTAIR